MKKRTTPEIAISTGRVAKMLGVRPSTIRLEIARGDLRAVKVGRHFRVFVSDFEKYTSARETRSAA